MTSRFPTHVRREEDVTVLRFEDRLTVETVAIFRAAFEEQLQAGERLILLNLGGVPNIESSGVGEIVRAQISLRNLGGQLKLCDLSPTAFESLRISGLLGVLDVHDDEESAQELPVLQQNLGGERRLGS